MSKKEHHKKSIHEIVRAWLDGKGFDGLVNNDIGCGCRFEDFMPCDQPCMTECKPAFAIELAEIEDFDYWMMNAKTRDDADADFSELGMERK